MTSPAQAQSTALRAAVGATAPLGGQMPAGGFCVDLFAAIGERIGATFEFSYMPGGEMIPAIVAGTIDVSCSGFGANNARREMGVAFTSAIFTNTEALLTLVTDAATYTAMADFRGQPVGAEAGTVYVTLLQNAGIENVVTCPTAQDCYALLRSGEIKAMIGAGPTTRYRQAQGELNDFRVVDTYVSVAVTYPGLVVRNTDTELLGQLQAALEGLKADGTLATLLERWALPAPPF